jgi:hypothetical protein
LPQPLAKVGVPAPATKRLLLAVVAHVGHTQGLQGAWHALSFCWKCRESGCGSNCASYKQRSGDNSQWGPLSTPPCPIWSPMRSVAPLMMVLLM